MGLIKFAAPASAILGIGFYSFIDVYRYLGVKSGLESLVGHGTLVTAQSISLALLRAQCFEHRARKAWEVRAMGMTGIPFPEDHAANLATIAQPYADALLGGVPSQRLGNRNYAASNDLQLLLGRGSGWRLLP
mgnify:CR=1 FL=1